MPHSSHTLLHQLALNSALKNLHATKCASVIGIIFSQSSSLSEPAAAPDLGLPQPTCQCPATAQQVLTLHQMIMRADSSSGHMLVFFVGKWDYLHGHEAGYRSAEPPRIAEQSDRQRRCEACTHLLGWLPKGQAGLLLSRF